MLQEVAVVQYPTAAKGENRQDSQGEPHAEGNLFGLVVLIKVVMVLVLVGHRRHFLVGVEEAVLIGAMVLVMMRVVGMLCVVFMLPVGGRMGGNLLPSLRTEEREPRSYASCKRRSKARPPIRPSPRCS